MFANPIWSILLLCLPVAVYWLVIRPRLKAKFTEIYAGIDSFWGRLWARLYAFRTFVVAALSAALIALPDLLVQIAPLDFSEILPRPWAAYVSPAALFLVAIMKAFETKPREEKS